MLGRRLRKAFLCPKDKLAIASVSVEKVPELMLVS
jgi:hypothetical protein